MIYDTLFVGCGPAALAAAVELSAGHRRVAIVDAGSAAVQRSCPGLKQSTCTSCAGDVCHVTMGLGGASATFGNKHCAFPASSGVLRIIPAVLRTAVLDAVNNTLGVSTSSLPETSEVDHRKNYRSDIVYRRQYMAMVDALSRALLDKADVRLGTEIVSIAKDDAGDFALTTANGESIKSRKVVLSVGRSGHWFVRRTLRELGVSFDEPLADIGFRLELDTADVDEGFLYQVDPKYKFGHPGLGTSRTFCTCIGGQVVPVKFGDGFYADGAFLNAPTNRTNIAFMARSHSPLPIDTLQAWCRDRNTASGSILKLAADIEVSGDNHAVERVMAAVGRQPTEAHETILRELLTHTLGGMTAPLIKPGRHVRANVFGPAIDAYWPVPRVLKGFKTECEGLSIIGDAAGASRGIVQAVASGIAWARAETGKARASVVSESVATPHTGVAL